MSKEKYLSVWRSEDNRYRVELSHEVIERMRTIAIEHAPNEVGTSLVGSYSDDGRTATINELAPLTPDSRGTRTTFVRGVVGLADYFSKLLNGSRGRRHYVGEWHSHPNGSVSPSPTDDCNQLAIANEVKTDCPEAVLVIVGGEVTAFSEVAVFVYSRNLGKIRLAAC